MRPLFSDFMWGWTLDLCWNAPFPLYKKVTLSQSVSVWGVLTLLWQNENVDLVVLWPRKRSSLQRSSLWRDPGRSLQLLPRPRMMMGLHGLWKEKDQGPCGLALFIFVFASVLWLTCLYSSCLQSHHKQAFSTFLVLGTGFGERKRENWPSKNIPSSGALKVNTNSGVKREMKKIKAKFRGGRKEAGRFTVDALRKTALKQGATVGRTSQRDSQAQRPWCGKQFNVLGMARNKKGHVAGAEGGREGKHRRGLGLRGSQGPAYGIWFWAGRWHGPKGRNRTFTELEAWKAASSWLATVLPPWVLLLCPFPNAPSGNAQSLSGYSLTGAHPGLFSPPRGISPRPRWVSQVPC